MTDKSLKNFSLTQIEESVAKALSELAGQDVKVTINAIDHPVVGDAVLWSGSGTWQASFAVQATHEPAPLGPDAPF